MTYKLQYLPSAQKEWRKLGHTVRQQFQTKLNERLTTPRVPSAALHSMPNHYKIKLRDSGYRLIYRVKDAVVTVLVVAIGKRDGGDVYKTAARRLADLD
jgi:mRNA interferase RelE/StbE